MSRSKWKNSFIHYKFLKKNLFNKKQILLWTKNSVATEILINKKLIVYCGKHFKKIHISDLKVGYKIGEYCTTRSKFFHKNKLKPTKTLSKSKVKIKKKKK